MKFFTTEEDQYLKDNYLIVPAKRMSKALGRTEGTARQRMKILQLVVPPEIIQKFKEDSRIKKGSIPPNKGKKQSEYMSAEAIARTAGTRFKKGDIPKNAYNEIGNISIRHNHKKRRQKPYKWICVSVGLWKMLHVINWEKVNGPVPKGFIIRFKNGDTMDCAIENLVMISLAENMFANTIHRYPDEIKSAIRSLKKLNKTIKNHGKEQN